MMSWFANMALIKRSINVVEQTMRGPPVLDIEPHVNHRNVPYVHRKGWRVVSEHPSRGNCYSTQFFHRESHVSLYFQPLRKRWLVLDG